MWSSAAFRNRVQAAELLAKELAHYKGKRPLVLGIPRGSIPMAKVIAEQLDGELDVVLVHKIGAPDNPEFAIGSVSEFGNVYHSFPMEQSAARAAEIYEVLFEYVERSARGELTRLKQRREMYSPVRPPVSPKDRIVIIVDDGIATGSTMLAAIRAVRSQGSQKIIVAAPVAAPRTVTLLRIEADELVILEAPEDFFSISQFYQEFPQVSDEEVVQLLSDAAAASRPEAENEAEAKAREKIKIA